MSRKIAHVAGPGWPLVAIIAVAWMFLISPLRSDIADANQSIANRVHQTSCGRGQSLRKLRPLAPKG